MDDKRFARVAKDPRFKKTPLKERKLKIDSRFEKMFTDKSFSTKYFVDKRGSHVGKTSTEDLHKFYDLDQEETVDDTDSPVIEKQGRDKTHKKKVQSKSKKMKKEKANISKQETSEEETETTSEDENSNSTGKLPSEPHVDSSDEERGEKIDFARGEGNLVSSDDDSEDYDGEDYSALEQDEVEHPWGEFHTAQTKMTEEATRRLAVCNLDWDRVTATDIFVLFNSFKLRQGLIHSVKIYPSEFGLEKMRHEDCYGPEELQEDSLEENHNTDNQEGSGFSSEKLRQYQLNRLKYYYAVVECDSAETAEKLYEECDGVEFALSGNLLDLRFIPGDMEFEHEPHSVATELPAPATYVAPEFSTTALHQTNVKLTWDETDPKRTRTTMRKFNKDDILEMDFKAYLASSSEEEDGEDEDNDGHDQDQESGDEEEQIKKYKELLKEIDNKERKEGEENDMEITWEPGLQETAKDLVTRKLKEKSERKLSPWEQYQEQKKKRRKERKRKEEEAADGESEDDIPADVDLSDPFFSQEFGPEFKESKTEERKPNRKHKKRGKYVQEEGAEKPGQKQKEELELLLMEENDDRQHFSLKGIMDSEKKTKKRKKKEKEPRTMEDNFQIDVKDSRFNALYTSHHFAVDPSDPQYKKTKAMETIIDERQKRRQRAEKEESPKEQNTTGHEQVKDPSLTMLVKSVKSKTGQFHQRKRKKTHQP